MLMPGILRENLFDDLFDDFAKPVQKSFVYATPANTVMKTDIRETDEGYEIYIDLPGYSKDNVKAELKEGYLTITASTSSDNESSDQNAKYIRRERYSGTCSRSFYVGEDVEQGDIKAKFENGILGIFVPKKEAKPKVEENKYISIEG